jgi:hypothetical protein
MNKVPDEMVPSMSGPGALGQGVPGSMVSKKRQDAAVKAAATRFRLSNTSEKMAKRAISNTVAYAPDVSRLVAQCRTLGIKLSAEERKTLTAYNRLMTRLKKEVRS